MKLAMEQASRVFTTGISRNSPRIAEIQDMAVRSSQEATAMGRDKTFEEKHLRVNLSGSPSYWRKPKTGLA